VRPALKEEFKSLGCWLVNKTDERRASMLLMMLWLYFLLAMIYVTIQDKMKIKRVDSIVAKV
jgi:hypothetical protein